MRSNFCAVSALTSLWFHYALEKNGSPKPLFEMDPERLSFYATIFIHQTFLENETINGKDGPINGPINGKTGLTFEKTTDRLDENEITILSSFIKQPDISLAKLALNLGIGRTTVLRIVTALKKKGLLYHVGARKNGRWVVSDKITKHLK